jgi:hypothetical protein
MDFADRDKAYCTKGIDALVWLRDVSSLTITEDTIMPNMKNHNDYPWHTYKCELASKFHEITQMYSCGIKARNYAMRNGINDWRDLTPSSLKFKRGPLRDRILKFVQQASDGPYEFPTLDTNSYFIDFEAITNLHDTFASFPDAEDHSMIFLVGIVHNDDHEFYMADNMSPEEEHRIISCMLDYIDPQGIIYYWGGAEKNLLNRVKCKFPDLTLRINALIMVDLCTVFKAEGFVLNGLMNYGLKHISKILYDADHITTIWPETSYIKDGVCAMIEAAKCYINGTNDETFLHIIEYNYIDCKVMQDILSYVNTI